SRCPCRVLGRGHRSYSCIVLLPYLRLPPCPADAFRGPSSRGHALVADRHRISARRERQFVFCGARCAPQRQGRPPRSPSPIEAIYLSAQHDLPSNPERPRPSVMVVTLAVNRRRERVARLGEARVKLRDLSGTTVAARILRGGRPLWRKGPQW